jgi:hypothetical protein
MGPSMPQPLYERLLKHGAVLLFVFLAVGSVLDAISNARPMLSERVTYGGTVTVIVVMVIAHLALRRLHDPSILNRHTARVTGLGPTSFMAVLGLIVLLWIPRVAGRFVPQRITTPDPTTGRLVLGPHSVTHDAAAQRLTVVLDVHNVGDRQIVATISHAVWLGSRRQLLNPDRSKPQPWRAELLPQHFSPVIFMVDGRSAEEVWNGTYEMKLTVDADYQARPGLWCHYSFSGMFQPEFQRITLLDSRTTPPECIGD